MIKSIIIGSSQDVTYYLKILELSNYIGETVCYISEPKSMVDIKGIFNTSFDAAFIVSEINNFIELITHLTKNGNHIYFVDQPNLKAEHLKGLEVLNNESQNIIFTELKELYHPIFKEFLVSKRNNISLNYNRNILSKKEIRKNILLASGFITILSNLPIKRFDLHSFDDQPQINIRLKLYGGSNCNIELKFNKIESFNIEMKSIEGDFHFNMIDQVLLNQNGVKFPTAKVSENQLTKICIDEFALAIILRRSILYPFSHFMLSINNLSRIERMF